jgi:hypothetical protein
MIRGMLRRMRRRGAEEHGAVIIIVAGCLVLFLGLLAYTIDIGGGRQAQQKAQLVADAAAEAGANAIPYPACTATNTPCISNVTTQATTIAAQNGACSACVTVVYPYNASYTQIRVSVRADAAGTVGAEFNRSSIPVAASAIAAAQTTSAVTNSTSSTVVTSTLTSTTSATVTNTSTGTVTSSTCATAGSNCLAIFASGTSCGGDSSAGNDPIVFGGGVHVSGGVWSDGSLDLGNGGSTFGPLTYARGCTVSPAASIQSSQNDDGNTFNNGYPTAASALTTWPLNYAADFSACSGSGCTGPCATGAGSCVSTLHTPSFCTAVSDASSWEIDAYYPYTLVSKQIYCAVGTGSGVKPNTPSTWNGALQVDGASGVIESTFVAGSITVGGGSSLTACGYNLPTYSVSGCTSSVPTPSTPNYPLFYAINGTVNESSGGNGLTGDWFVPNGSITVGGGTTFVGFLEAQTVNLSSGGITGDGPADSGSSVGSTATTTSTSTSVTTGTSTSLSSTTSTSITPHTNTAANGSALTG